MYCAHILDSKYNSTQRAGPVIELKNFYLDKES